MRKELIEVAQIYLRNIPPSSSVMYYYRDVMNGDNTIEGVLRVYVNGEEEITIEGVLTVHANGEEEMTIRVL